MATAAAAAVEHVGMPEAVHALSQATIYLALAPKSKEAAKAIGRARRHVREHGAATPPAALRSSGYALAGRKLERHLEHYGAQEPEAQEESQAAQTAVVWTRRVMSDVTAERLADPGMLDLHREQATIVVRRAVHLTERGGGGQWPA